MTGATFRSAYDGTPASPQPGAGGRASRRRSAPTSRWSLDICPPLPSPPRVVRRRRGPHDAWAERARAAFLGASRRDRGLDRPSSASCRAAPTRRCGHESASRIAALGFDGYGIGGLSVGEIARRDAARAGRGRRAPPADQVRYLMGVGDPVGMVEAVALGVDMFDCVLPTRLGRHGTVLSQHGTYHLRNVRYTADEGPLDDQCGLSDMRALDTRLCASPAPGRRAHGPSTHHRAQPLVDP